MMSRLRSTADFSPSAAPAVDSRETCKSYPQTAAKQRRNT